ncbi:MAG TPA: PQQ-binding-like beta-propeller repeat protein [Gaiellaceae bacterium]|nr:PQQ-binding-like beta-propeller repeat protein [Gaiellaceae bacterium]
MRRTWLAGTLVLLVLAGVGGARAQPSGGWLVYGNDAARSSATDTSLSPPSVRPAWYAPISGRVSAQALVAQDVPSPGQRTVYVATSKGVLYALAENGYVRWRADLGQLERICQQIDGYGITGTPAIDLATHAIYAADAFGRIHSLDLATGAERPGWPVTAYADFRRELVWGALTIVDGSVYFGTGSYCDRKMVGKVVRVQIATGSVSQWKVVPKRLGGGGGVWGWGGLAYSARRHSLYAVTGNAFEGGSNAGKRFREFAGYGERIVELGPDLRVRGSNHPADIHQKGDLDFVGSPVLFRHSVCGEVAAALNKNGFLYLWRTRRLGAGPVSSLRLSNPTLAAPLLSQAAYSPRTRALYVSTPGRLVRVDVDGRCRARIGWSRNVGSGLFNGSPTIAGDTVWLVENANAGSSLVAFRATSGQPRLQARLGGPSYVAPTVAGDRAYVPLYNGGVQGFALASVLGRQAGGSGSSLNEYRSFSDGMHGWASREDGVYSTDDGGATWRLVYPRSAVRVARVSLASGMISVGDRISRCGCRQVRLWTADGGATWTRTPSAVGSGFTAAAGTLWWWRGASLYRASVWPPGRGGLKGVRVSAGKGAIVDVKPVPGGAAALVSRRVGGFGFDRAPLLRFVQNRAVRNRVLPAVGGDVLVRSFEIGWPDIEVHGFDVTAFTRRQEGSVLWRSEDGGASWTVTRS